MDASWELPVVSSVLGSLTSWLCMVITDRNVKDNVRWVLDDLHALLHSGIDIDIPYHSSVHEDIPVEDLRLESARQRTRSHSWLSKHLNWSVFLSHRHVLTRVCVQGWDDKATFNRSSRVNDRSQSVQCWVWVQEAWLLKKKLEWRAWAQLPDILRRDSLPDFREPLTHLKFSACCPCRDTTCIDGACWDSRDHVPRVIRWISVV